ncbi:MAG: hypothetical protein RMX68_025040 [Aulosira sp. ZfuVER01]|nr:hypothetical protein [Aulosira sp. ZfuVER01]MDZ7999420.1 hypothetical protein [Aulosira sp. DedVER01a]MDZ8055395.1 hypothetical protein [Aulosira sp. ZfuCHP01]
MTREVKYDASHIKDVGYELWRSLSQTLGEKVTNKNLHRVLKRDAQRHCFQILKAKRPYAGMKITGAKGLTQALKSLPKILLNLE